MAMVGDGAYCMDGEREREREEKEGVGGHRFGSEVSRHGEYDRHLHGGKISMRPRSWPTCGTRGSPSLSLFFSTENFVNQNRSDVDVPIVMFRS